MKYAFSALALTGLLLLAFAVPGINIYHHLSLPDVDKYRISSHEHLGFNYKKMQVYIYKTTDITLNDEIKSMNTYKDAIRVLQEAEKGDIVTFHLFGYGGRSDATELLINNIRASKAHVKMRVESSVYSAHAYIAAYGDELEMLPFSFLMYHSSSLKNVKCAESEGEDRGVSNVEHCVEYIAANQTVDDKMINGIWFLTDKERNLINTGHDVYIQSDDYSRRKVGEPKAIK